MAVTCSLCGRTFPTIEKRNKHLSSKHISCDVCGKAFNTKASYNYHVSRVHNDMLSQLPGRKVFKCDHCGLQFLYRQSRNDHVEQNHLMARLAVRCSVCRQDFNTIKDLQKHKREDHVFDDQTGFVSHQNAFRKSCEVLRLQLPYEGDGAVKSVDEFYERFSPTVAKELENQLLKRNSPFKVWIVLFADMYKSSEGNITEYDTFYFRSGKNDNFIADVDDIPNFIEKSRSPVRSRFESLLTRGSNWSIYAITACTLEIAKARPLNGGCITDKITIGTLNELSNLNYLFSDNRKFSNGCLYYAIAKYFNKYTDDINVLDEWITENLERKNIKTPVSIHKLSDLEKQNSHINFKINVLELEVVEDTRNQISNVFPLRSNPYNSADYIINLLWIRFQSEVAMNKINDRPSQFCEFGGYGIDEESNFFSQTDFVNDFTNDIDNDNDFNGVDSVLLDRFRKIYDTRGHFMLIENLDIFLQYKNVRFICSNCLTGFRSFKDFELHENICIHFKPALIQMPQPGTKMSFQNFNYKFKLPYVIFYDFEAVLEPLPEKNRCFNCTEKNATDCNR
jgi:uncharacterized C2H2 Zn-finger protein